MEQILSLFEEAQRLGHLRGEVDPRMALIVAGLVFLCYPVVLSRIQRLFDEPLASPQRVLWARDQIVSVIMQGLVAPLNPTSATRKGR